MKDKENLSRPEEEDEDSDSFSLRVYKATKRHPTSSIEAELVITKTTSLFDGKKTVKYKDDPVMEGLVTSIIK